MSAIQQVMAGFGSVAAQGLTFVAAARSTSQGVTVPATAQEGDLAILIGFVEASEAAGTRFTPSGWTAGAGVTYSVYFMANWVYRILAAGDVGASRNCVTNGDILAGSAVLVFRPTVAIASVTKSSAAANINVAAVSHTPAAGTSPYVVFSGIWTTGATAAYSATASGCTDAYGSGAKVSGRYGIDTGAGTYTTTDTGTNYQVSGVLSIT